MLKCDISAKTNMIYVKTCRRLDLLLQNCVFFNMLIASNKIPNVLKVTLLKHILDYKCSMYYK